MWQNLRTDLSAMFTGDYDTREVPPTPSLFTFFYNGPSCNKNAHLHRVAEIRQRKDLRGSGNIRIATHRWEAEVGRVKREINISWRDHLHVIPRWDRSACPTLRGVDPRDRWIRRSGRQKRENYLPPFPLKETYPAPTWLCSLTYKQGGPACYRITDRPEMCPFFFFFRRTGGRNLVQLRLEQGRAAGLRRVHDLIQGVPRKAQAKEMIVFTYSCVYTYITRVETYERDLFYHAHLLKCQQMKPRSSGVICLLWTRFFSRETLYRAAIGAQVEKSRGSENFSG